MPVATPAAHLGLPCPTYDLPDVFGGQRSLADDHGSPALLVVFSCAHCPYVRAVEDRIIALHLEHAAAGLKTVLICSNDPAAYSEDSPDNLRIQAQQKQFPFPYLIDADQAVAKAFDAACTPDFFLFDGSRRLRYRGRLDDNWKRADLVRRRELSDAITALLRGGQVAAEQFPSLGCSIKWSS
jgi:peroxiredoxin